MKAGTEVAVDEINANGGINGRRLVVIYKDDQLDPKKGVRATQSSTGRLLALSVLHPCAEDI